MSTLPDFKLNDTGPLSQEFRRRNLVTFHQAIDFVWQLPYGRNTDKSDLSTVFSNACGTCGTKHALLKQVALEQGIDNIQLTIGLFQMNGRNTPSVAKRLQHHNIPFIPEAHCYLTFEGQRFDFTKTGPNGLDFEPYLIEETNILPDQITDYKVNYQKAYLKSWLTNTPGLQMDVDTLWTIREQCIQDLSDN